jgi:CelD/BcsL family acetyltransferase involved in cellulose biosynthesis
VDRASISAHLFVRAGATRAYWLGGFDDRWAACQPSVQVLAAAVEAGLESGDEWLELGPGGQHYKYRFADREDSLAWLTLTPRRS